MTVLRSLVLAVSLACAGGGAMAQMLILPGARAPAEAPPMMAPGAPDPGGPGLARPHPPRHDPGPRIINLAPDEQRPRPAKPAAVKAVSEESVLNRELRLNGAGGSLRLERVGRTSEIRARMTLQGVTAAKPDEACAIKLEGGEPVALDSQGKPDGVPRYELKAASCPVSFDVLDGSVWVRGPEEGCRDEAAACQADPRGLWGPEPGALMRDVRAIEQARGQADRIVRENYRAMTQRAAPGELRAIVVEQAAFSSEREQQCQDYAREAAHGFCHARFTEGRAALLATKLGTTGSVASPKAEASRKRPRRPVSRRAAPPPSPEWPAYGSDPNGIR